MNFEFDDIEKELKTEMSKFAVRRFLSLEPIDKFFKISLLIDDKDWIKSGILKDSIQINMITLLKPLIKGTETVGITISEIRPQKFGGSFPEQVMNIKIPVSPFSKSKGLDLKKIKESQCGSPIFTVDEPRALVKILKIIDNYEF